MSRPDFGSPTELEQALVAYGECVQESFPIAMRFRTDPFVGLITEIGSQHEEDGDLADAVAARCNSRFDLDRRLSAYQSEHPISPDAQRILVEEFITCASSLSNAASDLVLNANLDTLADIDGFVSGLSPRDPGLPADELVPISDCAAAAVGPERVFNDGYPWFTP